MPMPDHPVRPEIPKPPNLILEEGGVWIAYYHDMSSVIVFGSEITALRHGVLNSMAVKFVKWGEEIAKG